MADFSPEELDFLVDNLELLPAHERAEVQSMIEALGQRNAQTDAQNHFLSFMNTVEPSLLMGPQHKIIGNAFERICDGTLKRVIINIAPRHSKSTLASYLFPAWFLGRFPTKKIIMASHTGDLAVDFGRKVRNLVASPIYRSVFPDVALAPDSKAAGRWNTNLGGEYFALGVGAAMAGRGSDLCVNLASIVISKRGNIKAVDVVVGDYLWGRLGWGMVRHVIHSEHTNTIVINNKLRVSRKHPIWTANRGWVNAENLNTKDKLCTTSVCDKICIIYNKIEGTYHEKLHKGIQHMGDDAPTLQQPEGSKLHWVRRAWNKSVFAVGQIRCVLSRYGSGSDPTAHTGSGEQRRGLHTSQLQMGVVGSATEQSTGYGLYNRLWQNTKSGTVGSRDWIKSHTNKTSNFCNGATAGGGVKGRTNELEPTPCYSEGVVRRFYRKACILSGSFKKYRNACWGNLERAGQKVKDCLWLSMGIRSVVIEEHAPREFVNFHVEGDNTFICDTYLTHNCVIDDAHSEQEARSGNPTIFDSAYEWYQSGPRQRLQPGGAIVVLMTRWNKRDLSGRLIENMIRSPDGDEWEVIELPAIMPSGLPLWPEFWSLEELLRTKASMDSRYWQAQYMQAPTSEEGALVKREWWRPWTFKEPPDCEYIIGSLDAAAETNNRADHTSITVWGVFYREDEASGERAANIILLESIRERMEFPDLKDTAYSMYKEWDMDCLIVEKKSNGVALYQEMRRAGVPVSEVTPSRGSIMAPNDKTARLNSVADIIRAGLVWYPENERWAIDLIDEIAGFPSFGSDDRVDTTIMALARFRAGGFIKLPSDRGFDEEEQKFRSRQRKYY